MSNASPAPADSRTKPTRRASRPPTIQTSELQVSARRSCSSPCSSPHHTAEQQVRHDHEAHRRTSRPATQRRYRRRPAPRRPGRNPRIPPSRSGKSTNAVGTSKHPAARKAMPPRWRRDPARPQHNPPASPPHRAQSTPGGSRHRALEDEPSGDRSGDAEQDRGCQQGQVHGPPSPPCRARTIASERSATASFTKIEEMWLATVFGDRNSSSAMAWLRRPAATRSSTSRSRVGQLREGFFTSTRRREEAEDPLRNAWAEDRLAGNDSAYATIDLVLLGALEQVAHGAGTHGRRTPCRRRRTSSTPRSPCPERRHATGGSPRCRRSPASECP